MQQYQIHFKGVDKTPDSEENDITMPRIHRIDWKNALHHVMARGIEKSVIFRSEQDKESFADRLGNCVLETGVSVIAWCIMPNHIHILAITNDIPLSKFMQKLLTGHAVHFNKKYSRTGYLFQNRYRSILVQSEGYMHKLVKYIHLNPVKANMVRSVNCLDSYPWTSHIEIARPGKYPWQDRKRVLSEFGSDEASQLVAYNSFMRLEEYYQNDQMLENGNFALGNHGIQTIEHNGKGGMESHAQFRILGERNFAERIYRIIQHQNNGHLRNRSKQHELIEAILGFVSKEWGIPYEMLSSGSRVKAVKQARECASYALLNLIGIKLSDCAKLLGVTPEAVRQSALRYSTRSDYHSVIEELSNRLYN
ncbi:MAG: hypothetical protein AVO35_09135 [Candidatus Aegiribacteria sp. MLS_C]|nr:MAG: hypothetical protein AVO35_09135 [Candidatus Aegiribacteria sp. MLS_C]